MYRILCCSQFSASTVGPGMYFYQVEGIYYSSLPKLRRKHVLKKIQMCISKISHLHFFLVENNQCALSI